MMNRIFILLALFFILLVGSCRKPYPVKVTYMATGAVSAYNLQYLDDQNMLVETTVTPQSAQDVWSYGREAQQGDIVYINGKYDDISSGLKIQVLIDGKIYKQASTVGDTVNYLVVSGVVPFD